MTENDLPSAARRPWRLESPQGYAHGRTFSTLDRLLAFIRDDPSEHRFEHHRARNRDTGAIVSDHDLAAKANR